MKRRLLCLSVAALSLIGMSCEKNNLDVQSSPETSTISEGATSRGGAGGNDVSYCANPSITYLIMEKNGQNNNFSDIEGVVEVLRTPTQVEIKFICDPGFQLKNVSVWVGPKSLAPVNNSGHPQFGHFQVRNNNLGNVSTHTAIIPRSMITLTSNPETDPMIAIAHANVFKHNTESSYGKGTFFKPNGGKAQYISLEGYCGWAPPVGLPE